MNQNIRMAHTLTIILGAWLLAVPMIFSFSSAAALANCLIVGFFLIASTIVQAGVKHENGTWVNWLHIILAGWLILSPFALNYEADIFEMANQVIVGSLLFIVAIWEEGDEVVFKRKWT